MAFCRNCGNKLPDNAKFCNKCGTSVLPRTIPIKEKDGDFVLDTSELGENFTITVTEIKENEVAASSQAGETEAGGWGGEFVEDEDSKKK